MPDNMSEEMTRQVWKRRWQRRIAYNGALTVLLAAYFIVQLAGLIPNWSFALIIAGYIGAAAYLAEQTMLAEHKDGVGSRYPRTNNEARAAWFAYLGDQAYRFAGASVCIVAIAYLLLLLPHGFEFDEAFMLLLISAAPGNLVQTLFFTRGGDLPGE